MSETRSETKQKLLAKYLGRTEPSYSKTSGVMYQTHRTGTEAQTAHRTRHWKAQHFLPLSTCQIRGRDYSLPPSITTNAKQSQSVVTYTLSYHTRFFSSSIRLHLNTATSICLSSRLHELYQASGQDISTHPSQRHDVQQWRNKECIW